MRREKAIKNVITALISNIIVLLFGFITQKIFIITLGDEYLGLNSLLTNVVSMLAIVELGVGSAIIYNLYEPIAKKDSKTITSLLSFYRKTYNLVAIIIFILGLLLLPFLKYFVTTTLDVNIYLIFMLFVIDVICSYLLSYKRSILQADQRSYIINIVHILYVIILNSSLIGILFLTKNYILYLIIKCLCRFLENFIILIIANKEYPYIKEKANKLDKKIYKSIIQKVKGLFFHKIGSFVVLGTDNIIISKYLGNIMVAFYSNYYLIINAASTLLSQIFVALTASVGNLLVEKNDEKSYSLFKNIMFFDFWIYSFSAIGIFICMNSFISLWVGAERLLPITVLLVLVINYYMMGMRSSLGVYKDAAGIFYEDRFIPIIESIVNIVASIILVKYFGLLGVFLGTMLSSFVVALFGLPYFVYKKVFKKNMLDYYLLYFKYIILTFIIGGFTYLIFKLIIKYLVIKNYLLIFIIGFILVCIIPNLVYLIIFHNKNEFKYFFDIFKNILNKIKKFRRSKNEN